MEKNTSTVFPKKNQKANPPSRVYDGDHRDMDLTYEQLNEIIKLNKDPVKFNQLRPLVHEIFNFSNGDNNIDDIAKKIGFEFGLKINPIFVYQFVKKMEEIKLVKLNIRSNNK